MRVIALLGLNFLRTQWIALAVMTAYIAGIGGVFRTHVTHADILFFLRWHAGYAVFLATMMAIPALQMERKSRRILAVLAKGIHRWQYLGGLLCGSAMAAALFCALVGGIAAWLCQQGGVAGKGIPAVTVALFLSSVAGAATGLFFSTFLHPLLATGATSLAIGLPFALEAMGQKPVWELFPIAWLFHFLLEFQLQAEDSMSWGIAAAALAHIAVFWAAGALVFARRDVTILPE